MMNSTGAENAAWTVWPGSIFRCRTTPSTGDVMVAFLMFVWLTPSSARVLSTVPLALASSAMARWKVGLGRIDLRLGRDLAAGKRQDFAQAGQRGLGFGDGGLGLGQLGLGGS